MMNRALLLAFALACGCRVADLVAAEPAPLPEGVYVLCSIGGKALPYFVDRNSLETIEISADTLTVLAGGTFKVRQHRVHRLVDARRVLPRPKNFEPVSKETINANTWSGGFWFFDGTVLRLRDAAPADAQEWYHGPFDASGKLLLTHNAGVVFVYRPTGGTC